MKINKLMLFIVAVLAINSFVSVKAFGYRGSRVLSVPSPDFARLEPSDRVEEFE
jgi:hypothetical protein